MIDQLVPLGEGEQFQVFTRSQTLGGSDMPGIWEKPPFAAWVYIVMIGAGSGGGGGFSGIAGSARGGGGGGGSGGTIRVLAPAFMLPDRLYIRPGFGGPGGAAGTIGTAGSNTDLGPHPFGAGYGGSSNNIQLGQAAAGGAGGAGTVAVGGAGGAGVANTVGSSFIYGVVVGSQGLGATGGVGGAQTGAQGGDATIGNSAAGTTGGGGGGGTTSADFSGGTCVTPLISWIPSQARAAAGSVDGLAGPWFWGPAFFGGYGGGGGSASNAGVGGKGGNGAYGCGGGGGGGGTTGGAGGNGGDGIVMVWAF